MNFIDAIKAFFMGPQVDPVAIAVHNAFTAASDAYNAAFQSILEYATRGNNRYAIVSAAPQRDKSFPDNLFMADAYHEAVAIYTPG